MSNPHLMRAAGRDMKLYSWAFDGSFAAKSGGVFKVQVGNSTNKLTIKPSIKRKKRKVQKQSRKKNR